MYARNLFSISILSLWVCHVLSPRMCAQLHVNLRRMCLLLWLDGIFYKCHWDQVEWFSCYAERRPYWFSAWGIHQLLMKVSGTLQLERANFSISSLTSIRFYLLYFYTPGEYTFQTHKFPRRTLTYFHPQYFFLSWNLVSQKLMHLLISFSLISAGLLYLHFILSLILHFKWVSFTQYICVP